MPQSCNDGTGLILVASAHTYLVTQLSTFVETLHRPYVTKVNKREKNTSPSRTCEDSGPLESFKVPTFRWCTTFGSAGVAFPSHAGPSPAKTHPSSPGQMVSSRFPTRWDQVLEVIRARSPSGCTPSCCRCYTCAAADSERRRGSR